MLQKQVNDYPEERTRDAAAFPDSCELRTMRITAVFHAVFSLTVVLSVIGLLAALFYRLPNMAAASCIVLLASLGFLVACHVFYQRKKHVGLFRIPCAVAQAQALARCFHAEPVSERCFSSVFTQDKTTFRTNIYSIDRLTSESLKKAKSAAKKTAAKEDRLVPVFSAGNYARIDLILCESVEREFLEKTVDHAGRLLDRSECLFTVVVCIDQKTVYIPHIFDELDYPQVKRYAQFCGILSKMIDQFTSACAPEQSPA